MLFRSINANVLAIDVNIAAINSSVTQLQSNSVTQFTWLNNLTSSMSGITTSLINLDNVVGGYGNNVISNNFTGGNVFATQYYWANGLPFSTQIESAGNITFYYAGYFDFF